jgi:hypothetical protein
MRPNRIGVGADGLGVFLARDLRQLLTLDRQNVPINRCEPPGDVGCELVASCAMGDALTNVGS